ncbi:NYN domain-containing protein [Devosia sp. 2618]|uniref:NYN domain-containing protein n=1 Tax=Devosia sp. 2618 TaxID=3156454 RepID=UPI00339321BD
MTQSRTAILFDAENINCETAARALRVLGNDIQIKRAVGDFSSAALSNWINLSRTHGIELVFQPGTGKGKNGADIRLTIEAMDLIAGGLIDKLAIVTHDGDFTPLALRLRNAGIAVMGFSRTEPSPMFKAACTSFRVLQPEPVVAVIKPVVVVSPPKASPPAAPQLSAAEIARLRQVIAAACQSGPLDSGVLGNRINDANKTLFNKLGGTGKRIKKLIELGLIVSAGKGRLVKPSAPPLRRVS